MNFRLRLHPVAGLTERIALQDDVIPLKHAIHTGSGEVVSSFAVKAGQVCVCEAFARLIVHTFRYSGSLGPFSTLINKSGETMHPNSSLNDGSSPEVFLL